MVKLVKRISTKIGLGPGSVVFVGDRKMDKPLIRVMDYDAAGLEEKTPSEIEDCFPFRDAAALTWINIDGIHDEELIKSAGARFNLHPLIQEDIANTGHRPKIEETEGSIFVVLKMLYGNQPGDETFAEQVSIIFGENYVLSLQERKGDVFDPLRERIRKTIPRVRFLHADYLAYSLIDAVVDGYFLALENIAEKVESLEDELVGNPEPEHLKTIHELKRELIFLRRSVWPLREVVGALERSPSRLIHDSTKVYFRDLYEHAVQVIDTVESFRDMVSGLLDVYLSSVSNRMNQVMKVLTIIATIFIPLGFLAGVYGMNFSTSASPWNMPELGWRFGYVFFWLLALIIGGGLLWFFKKKKWL